MEENTIVDVKSEGVVNDSGFFGIANHTPILGSKRGDNSASAEGWTTKCASMQPPVLGIFSGHQNRLTISIYMIYQKTQSTRLAKPSV